MKFERGIDRHYRDAVERAFDFIIAKGNAEHREVAEAIVDSGLLIRVLPVSEINASGITGVINAVKTNMRMATRRFSIEDALAEVHITFAEETIGPTGGRGTEGTLVHEGRHAYDFARTIASISNSDVSPLSIFDPTLFELEYAAHKTSAEWMLAVGKDEYTDEGISLMILCNNDKGGCEVSEEGIRRRLSESYGLSEDGNQGPHASQMLGLVV